MRWLLFLLAIVMLLTLSCSQGSNITGPISNASLFFSLGGPTQYVANEGQGKAYQVHLWSFNGSVGLFNFANLDSLSSGSNYGFNVTTYDSLEADWTNPNGTTGRVRAKKP
jgi:hypothetical protein